MQTAFRLSPQSLPLLLLVTVVLMLVALSSTSAQVNMITNSGFETGDFSAWTIRGSIVGTSVQQDAAHSGFYGAELGATSLQEINQTVYVTGGQAYLLSFWLAVYGGANNAFAVTVLWDTGDSTLYFEEDAPDSNGFLKYSSLLVAPGTGLTTLSLIIYDENPPSHSLVAVPNLVLNGGFETGTFSHWTQTGNKTSRTPAFRPPARSVNRSPAPTLRPWEAIPSPTTSAS
jgi:hypothetical protein